MSNDEWQRGFTRREVLARGAALGLAAGAAGAMSGPAGAALRAAGATPKPKLGGTLRVALPGGSASTDNLDPNSAGGSPELFQSARELSFSKLTDIQPDGSYALQLAESLEPNANATVWQVKLKKGVEFQDGQPLTVDDVIWTFKKILAGANGAYGAAAGNISMVDPTGFKKIDSHTMTVKLIRPWSDMASAFGQRYLSIVKNGSQAPYTLQNFIGTGAFKLTSWTPGAHYTYKKNPNYFESGKPYLNGLDIVGIPDPVARVNALVAGQVDAIASVPAPQVAVLKGAGRNIIVNPGGSWDPLIMFTDTAPYNDPRVRKAMKLLIDRQQAVKSAVSGYGEIGNDLFARHDPLYDSSIPQRQYDPEQAASLLKAAGKSGQQFTLWTTDAISDAQSLALVFAQGAKKAGIKLNLQTAPAATFWDTTWGVQPFTFSSWGYRPFYAQWLQSYVSYNAQETRWHDSSQARASRMVYKAAATSDTAKQRQLTADAQQLMWDDGGYIIPYFIQTIDATTSHVHGVVPHVFPFLSWYQMWNFWLD